MKSYLNAEERTEMIILLAMQETLNKFVNSDALSDEEKKWLKTANTYIDKFNSSVFERMGEPLRHKIESTMKINTLSLCSRYGKKEHDCLSYCEAEDLKKAYNLTRSINCFGCERCDYKECGLFAMGVAIDIEGEETGGCPYKIDL